MYTYTKDREIPRKDSMSKCSEKNSTPDPKSFLESKDSKEILKEQVHDLEIQDARKRGLCCKNIRSWCTMEYCCAFYPVYIAIGGALCVLFIMGLFVLYIVAMVYFSNKVRDCPGGPQNCQGYNALLLITIIGPPCIPIVILIIAVISMVCIMIASKVCTNLEKINSEREINSTV